MWFTKAITIQFSLYLLITGGQKKASYPNKIRNRSESYFGIRYYQHGIKQMKFNENYRHKLLTLGYSPFASAYISQITAVGLAQEPHLQLSTTTSIKSKKKNYVQRLHKEKIIGKIHSYFTQKGNISRSKI